MNGKQSVTCAHLIHERSSSWAVMPNQASYDFIKASEKEQDLLSPDTLWPFSFWCNLSKWTRVLLLMHTCWFLFSFFFSRPLSRRLKTSRNMRFMTENMISDFIVVIPSCSLSAEELHLYIFDLQWRMFYKESDPAHKMLFRTRILTIIKCVKHDSKLKTFI